MAPDSAGEARTSRPAGSAPLSYREPLLMPTRPGVAPADQRDQVGNASLITETDRRPLPAGRTACRYASMPVLDLLDDEVNLTPARYVPKATASASLGRGAPGRGSAPSFTNCAT
ncbi:hypothetical protein GCM10017673_21380 [Streptosporangium violaceochromogenes]|nr:hypothetical protein GCM10017673_21380 [Streptosporangium violaceochromogenes]